MNRNAALERANENEQYLLDKLAKHENNNKIIREKCEQYWNESKISDAEVHAILSFIHRHTIIE